VTVLSAAAVQVNEISEAVPVLFVEILRYWIELYGMTAPEIRAAFAVIAGYPAAAFAATAFVR
jgi:hypothetical protein